MEEPRMILFMLLAAFLQGSTPVPMRSIEKSSQSFIENPRQIVVRTEAEWDALWRQHAANRPRPAVDFAREMVVGVCLGTRNTAGYAVEIAGVEKEAGGGLVVRYRETAPGRGAVTAQIIVSPCHLVAVPHTDGAVGFEKAAG
jgi:hypothetical protein